MVRRFLTSDCSQPMPSDLQKVVDRADKTPFALCRFETATGKATTSEICLDVAEDRFGRDLAFRIGGSTLGSLKAIQHRFAKHCGVGESAPAVREQPTGPRV